jgi:hypothetical protein
MTSIRLDPKLRFGADLLARHERRSLASTVEWALLKLLEQTRYLRGLRVEQTKDGQVIDTPIEVPLSAVLEEVWDDRESVRTVKLGLHYRSLLSIEDREAMDIVRADERFWRDWNAREPNYAEIERLWPLIQRKAAGEDVSFD